MRFYLLPPVQSIDLNSLIACSKKRSWTVILALALTLPLSAQIALPEDSGSKKKESQRPGGKAVNLSDYTTNSSASKASNSSTKALNLNGSDYVITSEHVSRVSGIHHIYLRQAINGIEVFGTESSVHFDRSGSKIKEHNNFVPNISSELLNASPSLSAEEAILSVSNQMGYEVQNLSEIERSSGANQKALFSKAGISGTEIPVKLMFYYREGIGATLVWELSVQEVNSSDWWNFRVDAANGTIIDKENWTVSCIDGLCTHAHSETNLDICEDDITEVSIATVEDEATALVGSYRVFALPLESPYFGSRTLEANPDDPTASPFGWHDTNGAAGAEYTYTKGNNADAYDDDNNSNSGTVADHAEGGAGLNFDFPFDLTSGGLPVYNNTNQSEDAAVTNLFYWTNVIHDVMYHYGFDEPAGNFQENNYGNGGAGSDSVNSEAQDGSGTCNANFGTPADGGNPRMQMYVCDNAGNSNSNDGDYDNLVIVHEYGHGISNRLTGGPGNASALNNAEQMGEGWSDFYGYMLTMDASNYNSDRTVGTFLFEQGAGGSGIRNAPYSTSMTTNPWTYAGVANTGSISSPHGIGFIWASMLYEMVQGLIAQHGFDPDLYNGTGGNNIAMTLVTEGLKLQGSSPGFVDGRDAILLADQNIYGGANQCIIWEAFAKRGLGYSASQGSSNSRTDGVEAFDLPPGTAAFTNSIADVCITQGIQTGLGGGTPTGGTYSGPGVTDDGNGTTYTFDPSVAGVGTATVTYTVNDACSGGLANLDQTIEVTDGLPDLVCQDISVTLDGGGNATVQWQDVVANKIPGGYTHSLVGGNSLETMTGSDIGLGDDAITGAIPLGFDFNFYGTTYSNVYICSNGFITFSQNAGMTAAQSRTAQTVPDPTLPNNIVALFWGDLDPSAGGTIKYQTFGTAPNRKFVVEYQNVRFWNQTATVSGQVHLYEGSNLIEVHLGNVAFGNQNKTMGIENSDGTDGLTNAATNNAGWSSTNPLLADFVSLPDTFADNCGNSVSLSLSKSAFTCKDVGENVITITADDGNGGVSTCTATVTVSGNPTTYSGGTWDSGPPTLGSSARFSSDYDMNSGSNPSIDACSCTIDSGVTVTVGPGDYMNVDGNINVDGTLIVNHTGSVVQIDDTAAVNKGPGAVINVELTTPPLKSRDFMLMGTPMTAETRGGVFTNSYNVQQHTPSNFIPHPAVPAGGTNFQDDNFDDWNGYNVGGNVITPGEGFLVYPQSAYIDPAYAGPPPVTTIEFPLTYSQGTLNTGNVDRPIVFNGLGSNPDGTPNILSNPYASPIDAGALISNNSLINELYFWEHLTPPSAAIPGANDINVSMGDLSIYNGTMGLPAANDPGSSTAPNGVISTGQGFAIKAFGAGTVTFSNSMRLTTGNITLRTPEGMEKLLLKVEGQQYETRSYTGIGFRSDATPQIDEGMDSNRLATLISLYSHLEDGSGQLGIQTRESFESGIKIPMGFASQIKEDTSYKISIIEVMGTNLSTSNIYLVDHLTGMVTDLTQSDYEFRSDKGTFNQRFTLQFETEVLGNGDLALNSISLYPNPAEALLNVVSPNAEITGITIHDVQGRKVEELKVNNERSSQVDISVLDTALYFVTVDTENGSVTKRIVKK